MVTAQGAARHYLRLLDWIHGHLEPRTYLEIGVGHGKSLAKAMPGTVAVAIDPHARKLEPVRAELRRFTTTSDAFFAKEDLRSVLDDRPVDLAFIDGRHLFEFALRDFMNVERFCAAGSVVLVHDCNPLDEVTAARERTTKIWTGDVWKLIACLKEARPGLAVSTVDVAPSGVGIVTGLDPSSTALSERYEELVDRFLGLEYAAVDGDRAGTLNLVPDDWEIVSGLLPSPFAEPARTG